MGGRGVKNNRQDLKEVGGQGKDVIRFPGTHSSPPTKVGISIESKIGGDTTSNKEQLLDYAEKEIDWQSGWFIGIPRP